MEEVGTLIFLMLLEDSELSIDLPSFLKPTIPALGSILNQISMQERENRTQ